MSFVKCSPYPRLTRLSPSYRELLCSPNSGFWQVPLSEESQLLTAFITPFGRYCFTKLPFGISCSPELFQKRIKEALDGLDGVVTNMDDVLIFGSNQSEHDTRLTTVLKCLDSRGVTLNAEKCEFSTKSVKFLAHIVDRKGIRADPDKTRAIRELDRPENVTELRFPEWPTS